MLKATLKALRAANDFDIAAGVHEDLLNAFFKAHHDSEHPKPVNVYKGQGDLAELRLGFRYNIAKAGVLDLAPITAFARNYKRWILRIPEVLGRQKKSQLRTLLNTPQPHLKVQAPRIEVTLEMKDTGKEITVPFSLTIECLVTTDNEQHLRLTPIRAYVDDPAALEKAVLQQAKKAGVLRGHSDVTCYDVLELVKYIVNVVLADRIGAFVATIPLPSLVKVFEDVSIGDLQVEVRNNFAIVMAKISTKSAMLTETQYALESASSMQTLAGRAEAAATAQHEKITNDAKQMKIADVGGSTPGTNGFFLLLSKNFFQKLANKYIRLDEGDEQGGSVGPIEWRYGWRLRVWNPLVSIVRDNLLVDFDFAGSAWAKARGKTHCGPTPWIGIRIGANANPARLITKFYSRNGNTVGMSAGTRPFWIDWVVSGVPWPISEIIALILEALTNVVIWIVSLIGIRWNRDIVVIPSPVPGTSLPARVVLDNRIGNYQGDLAVTGVVKF